MTVYVIDLFCGMGGVSHGAKIAGANVLLAVDCWKEALQVHEFYHPKCKHVNMKMGGNKDKLRKVIFESVSKLKQSDKLHIHASPPCQNLSSANQNNKDEDAGLKLTWWTIKFLQDNFSDIRNVTWSVEQVANSLYVNKLEKKKIIFYVYEMWKYGICQNRKRVFVFNKHINLPEQQSVFLHNILTIPRAAKYLGGSNVSASKIGRVSSISIKPITKKTIAYTIVSKPSCYIDANYEFMRYCTLQESLKLQTFPSDFLDKFKLTMSVKWKLVGNCIPPRFFELVLKTLTKN